MQATEMTERTLLAATDLPSGEPQAKKLVQRYVRAYFQEVAQAMKSSGYRIGAYGSGLVCFYLLGEKPVELCWLANARVGRVTRGLRRPASGP